MRPRSILVAHREALAAEGIATALARFPHLSPIAIATTADEAVREGITAEAAAIDAAMPRASAAASALRQCGARVVFIGGSCDPEDDDGIRVLPSSPVATLAYALVPELRHRGTVADCLTVRERQILSLGAQGLAAKQVARHLGISAKTVENHKTRIFAKLGVPNQTAAVSLAVADGFGAGGWASWSRSGT